ncbi:TetR/AcrR family transcriptional regulator [Pseudorhodoferax sp. Leaf267]|uniref:TetR/AcrR family transcriptional regulator n=1 Tax=Pseudorhodoferax sp. Leaf267 TaxID=1736316 RepID=UPI0006F8077A|nr:TetR/AcrR family transcriptional regulator [Pseudorhodoferax sp. Leaf267]KQP12684.1 TetR family transcriptional regulator [Pseudorhodoferax sp. Leaf267]
MNQTVHSRRRTASSRSRGKETTRTNDPARTMANIMDVALVEFAEKGLAGARIDEIAAATQTSKRMIYYYFGSKEGLYLAVLEASYAAMRETEADLHLDDLAPPDALRRLVEFTFDHHFASEPYIRLVMAENMLRGQFLAQSDNIQQLNIPAISAIEKVYARGVAGGYFRKGLDPIDLHATISALTFFNVANRHTFGLIFKRDYADPKVAAKRREVIVETVLRYARI